MKQLLMVTGIFLFICILITSFAGKKTEATNNSVTHNDTEMILDSISPTSGQDISEEHYIIREYDKRIAVFEENGSSPLYVTEVYVSELPKADKKLMKEGIHVNSRKELTRLIEDYTS